MRYAWRPRPHPRSSRITFRRRRDFPRARASASPRPIDQYVCWARTQDSRTWADKIRHGGVCSGVGFPPGAREREAFFSFMFVVPNAGFRQTKNDPAGYRRHEQIRHGFSQGALYLFNQSRRNGACDGTGIALILSQADVIVVIANVASRTAGRHSLPDGGSMRSASTRGFCNHSAFDMTAHRSDFDWTASPAHIDLLSKFVSPRDLSWSSTQIRYRSV